MSKKLITPVLLIVLLASCKIKGYEESDSSIGHPSSQTDHVDKSDTVFTDETHSDNNSTTSKITEKEPTTDPYINITEKEFYANYVPATSYSDSRYRTAHHFMSGSIAEQLQRPTIAEDQPMEDGMYCFNSKSGLRSDGNAYDIVDKDGRIVNTIYKGGAYVILEEVAAYLYAFGDIPANYTSSKKAKPSSSPWGKYLRLNHSYFSCDTDQYKYEPVLPEVNDKKYYEIDVGTTGSFEYSTVSTKGEYNNGTTIIRGASRLVYTRYIGNNLIEKPEDRKVFYTFNHYNDFQEYLNYENGWGQWFGNISGGGTMDNNTAIYKTSYPSVYKKNFW